MDKTDLPTCCDHNPQHDKKKWMAPNLVLLDESIDSTGNNLFEDQSGGGVAHS